MKRYGFNPDTTHQAIVFEQGTEAATKETHVGDTPGLIVGSSEWGWISEEDGRRICAALQYFSESTTVEVERLAEERFYLTENEVTTMSNEPTVQDAITLRTQLESEIFALLRKYEKATGLVPTNIWVHTTDQRFFGTEETKKLLVSVRVEVKL